MNPLVLRILQSVLHIAGLSLFVFLLTSVVPGNFFSDQQLEPTRNAETVSAWLRAERAAGPWPLRYVQWLGSCVTGDCGKSLAYGLPVTDLIAARWVSTLAIGLPAWLLGWAVGLALASRPLVRIEPVLTALPILPEVILASLLLWLTVALRLPLGDGLLLSIIVLAAPLAAVVFLHARRGIAAAQNSRFVQLAALRGVSHSLLWRRYVLPAAANPLISLLAPSAASVVGSALAVETLVGRAGLGALFLEAFQTRDYPVVQVVLVALGLVLAMVSLAADLLLYWLDPRIRLAGERRQA